MPYGILADIVVLVHLGFVIFAMLGAVLIIWWRWVLWLHLPAVSWAIWIALTGGVCPLTPLENWLRIRAGRGAYRGYFIDHYLIPLLYPAGLTRHIQILLGVFVVIINLALYIFIFFLSRRQNE